MNTGGSGAFGIGQVLTTSYLIVLRHFILFFALAFAANSPNLVLDFLAPPEAPQWINTVAPEVQAAPGHPALPVISPWIVLPLIVAGIVASFVLSAATTYLMIADLRGTAFSLAEALAGGLRALLPLLGVLAVLFLMLFGFAIVVGLVWGALAIGVFHDPKSPFGAIAAVLFIVPVLIVALRLTLVVPVIVVERMGPIDSMKRSADLTKGSIWRILGLFVVVGLILVAINAVLFGGAAALLGVEAFFTPVAIVARHVILSAEIPFYWAIVAVLYYYLRTADEGSAATPA